MKISGKKDQKWLIKSGEVVTGPFEFQEVVDGLSNGKLKDNDEVKGPGERWKLIFEHSVFLGVVERLKSLSQRGRSSSITQTLRISHSGQTITDLVSKTDLTQPTHDAEEFLKEQTSGPGALKDVEAVRDDKRSFSQVFQFVVLGIFFLVLFAGFAFFWLGSKEAYQKEKQASRRSLFNNWVDQGLKYSKVGEYLRALEYLRSANELSFVHPESTLLLSSLMIQVEGNYSQAEIMIEKLFLGNYQKEFVRRGKNLLGMGLTYQGKYNRALESLNQSLIVNDDYNPARINKAYVLLKLDLERGPGLVQTRQPLKERALTFLTQGDYGGNGSLYAGYSALYSYLLIRALVQEGYGFQSRNQVLSKKYFAKAKKLSQKYSRGLYSLKQEILFLGALAQMELSDSISDFESSVWSFLKVNPLWSDLHVWDLHYNFQITSWKDYGGLCEKLSSRLSPYIGKLVRGFCQFKQGDQAGAQLTFESLLSTHPSEGLLYSLYVSVLFSLGENQKAKSFFSKISRVQPKGPLVLNLLTGCLIIKDKACIENTLKSSYVSQIPLIYQLWGKAQLSPQKRASLVQRGLALDSEFIPLLKMREGL